jgi:hypothetical protein
VVRETRVTETALRRFHPRARELACPGKPLRKGFEPAKAPKSKERNEKPNCFRTNLNMGFRLTEETLRNPHPKAR